MTSLNKSNEMHTVYANSNTCNFCKKTVVFSKSDRAWKTTNGQGNVRCYYTVEVA